MANIRFYNTLTKEIDLFSPLHPPTVTIYSCGPTVYDFAHIGNLRSYVFADILHRTLEYATYSVNHVINITDVGHLTSDADSGEDKMMKGLKREELPFSLTGMKQLAEKYEEYFKEDLKALNIKQANVFPRASEHIKEQIALIEKLEEKGMIYTTDNGVYFDTTKDPHYGALGGLTETDEARARIEGADEKKSHRDFALWKFNTELGWESPWGKGFPGWHIECSAMSQKYLGETFDIHTGGVDHIPVHHNNEIAQSECATGEPLARFWMHNEFVNIESGKMAKSAGNFITLRTLKEHSIHPLAYRYWLLTSHYRTAVTFSYDAIHAAERAFEDLLRFLWHAKQDNKNGTIIGEWKEKFQTYLYDDLDTPGALAYIHTQLGTTENLGNEYTTLLDMDKALGLDLEHLIDLITSIPAEIKILTEQRDMLRKDKKWEESDKIRSQIESKGFAVEDGEEKTLIWRTLQSLTKQQ